MKNLNSYESVKAALDEFLAREGSRLDKYNIITRKMWLTIGKPEPQAEQFARCLQNLAEAFTGDSWKVMYKAEKPHPAG